MKTRLHTFCLLLACLLGLAFAIPAFALNTPTLKVLAPASRKGVVSVPVLNARAKPGLTYEVVAKLGQGAEVEIVGENDAWYEIVAPADSEAWCAARFISSNGRVVDSDVRVRSGPGVVFSDYAIVPEGERLTLIGEPVTGGWQKIVPPAGATIWANKEYIRTGSAPAPAAITATVATTETDAAAEGDAARHNPAPTPASSQVIAPSPGTIANPVATAVVTTPATPALKPVVEESKPLVAAPPEVKGEATTIDPTPTATKTAANSQAVDIAWIPETPATPPKTDARQPAEIALPELPGKATVGAATPLVEGPDADGNVSRAGVLVSLRGDATSFATHALVRRQGAQSVLVGYAETDLFNLAEWANREVRIYGRERFHEGWQQPVIHVTGIQLSPSAE